MGYKDKWKIWNYEFFKKIGEKFVTLDLVINFYIQHSIHKLWKKKMDKLEYIKTKIFCKKHDKENERRSHRVEDIIWGQCLMKYLLSKICK